MKSFSFLIGLLTLLVLGLTTCTKKAAGPPNILFILADDWSFPYASIYGDSTLRTPNLDRLAKHGMLFTNAYCASPSCTPSRAAMLTGKYPHNLGEGVNLCGRLDHTIPTYVQLLRKEGYKVAFDRKGWAPGDFLKMGYTENPAGDSAKLGFGPFIDQLPNNQPFFFWFGTNDPHRPFDLGSGKKLGIDPQKIHLPKFLPDTPEVRGDVADYLSEVERLDTEIGELLNKLERSGKLENTIIVVASDNGMPFPHAKANLYDYGTHIPLLISRFDGTKPGQNDSFVNLIDLMPTFLDWAGVRERPSVDGISLVPVLSGKKTVHRSEVFLERERHCLCRAELDSGAGYPMRAIRTNDFLYIRNFRPNRMPAGDERIAHTPSEYGDVDGGPTKVYMMDHRKEAAVQSLFELGFGKRPAEELYVLKADPYNLHNQAANAQYASIKKELSQRLTQWMQQEHDPRLGGGGDQVDRYESTTHAWITRTGIIFWDK